MPQSTIYLDEVEATTRKKKVNIHKIFVLLYLPYICDWNNSGIAFFLFEKVQLIMTILFLRPKLEFHITQTQCFFKNVNYITVH